MRPVRSVVVVTAREFDKDARFSSNGPSVVPRREQHDFVPAEIFSRAVIHRDVKGPGKHEGNVRQLAALGARVFF